MCYTVFRKREERVKDGTPLQSGKQQKVSTTKNHPREKEKERKTMENINERIAKLEKAIFYLEMKDGWNWHDFQDMDKMKAELRKLEKERDAQ